MILVAGGTGTLGVPLVRVLAASGERVRVLTRDPGRAEALRAAGIEATAATSAIPRPSPRRAPAARP